MRRFFVAPESIAGDRLTVRGAQGRHLAVVLRLRPGDHILAVDGSGLERVVELERVTPEETTGRILDTHPGTQPAIHLTLLQGVPKGSKMDDVIRMGTELGVAEFIPILTQRTVAEGRQRTGRWRKIAVEAAKQARRSDIPAVHGPLPLSTALGLIAGYDLSLLLWEGERERTVAKALIRTEAASRVAVIIGPEGGLEKSEVDEAVQHGAVPVSLGPLVLRTETAGVVALSIVLYELALRRRAVQDGTSQGATPGHPKPFTAG